MEIILLKDIPTLGKKYDVKTVRDGYGRNFLLPQKLAALSSVINLKNLEAMRNAEQEKKAKMFKEAAVSLELLKEKEIAIKVKANEKGELFGSISVKTISDELKKQGLNIPEDCINLKEHIKHIGEHDVEIKVGDNTGKIKLKVEEEN